MGRNRKDFWTTLGSKPKGFSFVRGQVSMYTHMVDVYIMDSNNVFKKILIDQIYIKIKIKNDDYGKQLDSDITRFEIEKELGTSSFTYDDNFFKRDGCLFPYISYIKLTSPIENYYHFRKIKNRKEKLQKITNKLK